MYMFFREKSHGVSKKLRDGSEPAKFAGILNVMFTLID